MGRSPCCDESGLKKGPWTPEEDQKLVNHIKKHGHGSWRALPKLAGLNRCGKSCRLRWTNYLKPDIKRGKFSKEEEETILNLHSVLGNKWSAIATHLPGRTDNEIKNFWNTNLKKKLIQMGFDPMTHRPQTDLFSSLSHLIAMSNLKELMEQHSWGEQCAGGLQTEASLMSRLQYMQYLLQPPPTPPVIFPSILSNNICSSNNGTTEVETFNPLMNSLGSDSTPVMNISMLNTPTFQSIGESFPFDHLPDLQVPNCNYQTPLSNKDDMAEKFDFNSLSHSENYSIATSSFFPSSSSSPSPPPGHIASPASISVAAIQGEGSGSNSSYDQSFSHELFFEDSMVFHDIA